MKVERVETLRADAGWRMFSYLKVTTDRRHHRLVRVQREFRQQPAWPT